MCKNAPKVKRAEIKKKKWDERINDLMREFCAPFNKRMTLIREVDESAKESDTDQMLYDRAYSKFKAAGYFL